MVANTPTRSRERFAPSYEHFLLPCRAALFDPGRACGPPRSLAALLSPRDEGVAGARRMPCGYSAKLRRSPSARRGDFIPSPGELFTPNWYDGAQALRASRSQDRRSRQERPEGERSEASPERGHRSAPPTTFRSTRDPFAGADEQIISWGQRWGDRFLFLCPGPATLFDPGRAFGPPRSLVCCPRSAKRWDNRAPQRPPYRLSHQTRACPCLES